MYRNNQNFDKHEDMLEEMLTALENQLRELAVTACRLKLEMVEGEYEDECEPPVMVMTIDPTGQIDICTQDEGDDLLEDEDSLEDFIVFDDLLILTCEASKVVELGGVRYLLGPAVIREIDDDGNDCSINAETIGNAFDFMEVNLTGIKVDGKEIPAFRLVEE